jgi:hypothetical protein
MILFAEKFSKKLAFLTQNKAKLWNILKITLFFEKSANIFAENCRKSQKIVIITSTPQLGHNMFQRLLTIALKALFYVVGQFLTDRI